MVDKDDKPAQDDDDTFWTWQEQARLDRKARVKDNDERFDLMLAIQLAFAPGPRRRPGQIPGKSGIRKNGPKPK